MEQWRIKQEEHIRKTIIFIKTLHLFTRDLDWVLKTYTSFKESYEGILGTARLLLKVRKLTSNLKWGGWKCIFSSNLHNFEKNGERG